MNDLPEVPPIKSVLSAAGIHAESKNFEELFAELVEERGRGSVRASLEAAVHEYFSSLRLPAVPTIFDHLILSLRPKDVIAIFNWDPFLIQAARRNGSVGGIPQLVFLHGNVSEGYCEADKILGIRGGTCSRCR
jgi:hypothetical protein